LGTNAGNALHEDLLQAQQSIVVVSPHVSEESVELLLRKHHDGVNVMLITSTDIERSRESQKIYKKLITQSREINESTKRYRILGLVVLYTWVIGSIVSAIAGTFLGDIRYLWPLFLLPIGFLAIAGLNKLRVYRYRYLANMPFYVAASPYADYSTNHQVFINAAVYIVDGRFAYIGSANFTREGLFEHYESMIKIVDSDIISYLYNEVNQIISDQNRLFRDINFIGKHIYPEPIN
jgi:phosphatidylserine/phosphatidylglycerophosphate/cardiolipin synthase-like enzyme